MWCKVKWINLCTRIILIWLCSTCLTFLVDWPLIEIFVFVLVTHATPTKQYCTDLTKIHVLCVYILLEFDSRLVSYYPCHVVCINACSVYYINLRSVFFVHFFDRFLRKCFLHLKLLVYWSSTRDTSTHMHIKYKYWDREH